MYVNLCVDRPQSSDAWVLAKPGITQAVSIASFAYMCHHSTFLLYDSLKQPTEAHWARLTHASVFSSALIEIFFAFFGYATFTGFVQGSYISFFYLIVNKCKVNVAIIYRMIYSALYLMK